jgi:uncharacterized protein YjiS (DUF1127 family)
MRVLTELPLQHAAEPSKKPGAASLVAGALKKAADWILLAMERSQQRRALMSLSDHQLADIGLTRDEMLSATARTIWRSEAPAATPGLAPSNDDWRDAA